MSEITEEEERQQLDCSQTGRVSVVDCVWLPSFGKEMGGGVPGNQLNAVNLMRKPPPLIQFG